MSNCSFKTTIFFNNLAFVLTNIFLTSGRFKKKYGSVIRSRSIVRLVPYSYLRLDPDLKHSLFAFFKGQCHKIFNTFSYQKPLPGHHLNRQKRLVKYLVFANSFAKNVCQSLTTLTLCPHCRWLCRQHVSVDVDYADMSSIVVDYADTVSMVVATTKNAIENLVTLSIWTLIDLAWTQTR